MPEKKYPTSEIVRREQEIYDRDIRAYVEGEHHGKYLAVDVDSGVYAMGSNSLDAIKSLHNLKPDAVAFLLRVGHATATRFRSPRVRRS